MEYAQETIEGIQSADAGASETWKVVAYDAVKQIASGQATFTADDVMRVLETKPVKTHTLRAFGPVMIRIQRDGIAEQTNQYVPSERKAQHNCPIRVWKSKLFGESHV